MKKTECETNKLLSLVIYTGNLLHSIEEPCIHFVKWMHVITGTRESRRHLIPEEESRDCYPSHNRSFHEPDGQEEGYPFLLFPLKTTASQLHRKERKRKEVITRIL